MERWADVIGYEATYEVSENGCIRNKCTGKVLKPEHTRTRYLRIELAGAKRFQIHRIVMAAFHGASELTVNHKNGIRSDNRLSNLEYLSNSANHKHSYDVLNRWRPEGSKHGMSKLTEDTVREIISLATAFTGRELAKKFNVSNGTISLILSRKTWRHLHSLSG